MVDEPHLSDLTARIIAARPAKQLLDPGRPYHFLVEPELSAAGQVEDVATIFLTNRECPFKCLMCDLWKNTLDETVPVGAIPTQIDFALQQLPPAAHLKLYNSGNFFDQQAIPRDDWPDIAHRARRFKSVIVENHPRLCGESCGEFKTLLGATELEIALGLETSHAPTLAKLNKQMTTDDFARACDLLSSMEIRIRAFVLLRPPNTTEQEGIERAIESTRFAFDCGASCVAVIPTRSGNGILDTMQRAGTFASPRLNALEQVMDETTGWSRGRVFADLWDIEAFATCRQCVSARVQRLFQMNQTQTVLSSIQCPGCSPPLGPDF